MAVSVIPTIPGPQQVTLALSGVLYTLTFQYRNDPGGLGGWTIDIADSSGNPIIQGIPLVTGADLLGQYEYLGLDGGLYVQTPNDLDVMPTFDNLGTDCFVYWVDAT